MIVHKNDSGFLLTHLLRGATRQKKEPSGSKKFLLTRLCEARLHQSRLHNRRCHFYSRASARRDDVRSVYPAVNGDFYSRASARRDDGQGQRPGAVEDFYSRASARRDRAPPARAGGKTISTHAPLRGATIGMMNAVVSVSFLLTRLCEARQIGLSAPSILQQFLLTRLCEARPARRGACAARHHYFYSRASARRDRYI